MPLALDAGAVCVDGLPEANDVQAGLIGQLGQNLQNLLRRFHLDRFFSDVAVYCDKRKKQK